MKSFPKSLKATSHLKVRTFLTISFCSGSSLEAHFGPPNHSKTLRRRSVNGVQNRFDSSSSPNIPLRRDEKLQKRTKAILYVKTHVSFAISFALGTQFGSNIGLPQLLRPQFPSSHHYVKPYFFNPKRLSIIISLPKPLKASSQVKIRIHLTIFFRSGSSLEAYFGFPMRSKALRRRSINGLQLHWELWELLGELWELPWELWELLWEF